MNFINTLSLITLTLQLNTKCVYLFKIIMNLIITWALKTLIFLLGINTFAHKTVLYITKYLSLKYNHLT